MLTAGGMGFSLNPIKAVKKVGSGVVSVAKKTGSVTASAARATGHGVTTAAKATGHGVAVAAKTTAHVAVAAGKLAIKPVEFAAQLALAPVKLAMRPVKSRLNTLINRRANKIAWDKRKSKTPTPAEKSEAKSWLKAKLNRQPPHGPLLAMLAGAPDTMNFGSPPMSTELGVIPAVVIALIPVFIAILNVLLRELAKSGEAPVQIGPNGQPLMPPGMDPAMVPEGGDPFAMMPPEGGLPPGDPNAMIPVPGDGGDGAVEAPDGSVTLPGGIRAQKGNLMMFGLIGAGLLAVVLLTRKKS